MFAKFSLLSILALIAFGQVSLGQDAVDSSFEGQIRPFMQKYCQRCHNADKATSGVRVDNLDPAFEERQLKLWLGILHHTANGSMPPDGAKQPNQAEKAQMVAWMEKGIARARMRPTPRNGGARRLTVAQYRNTLRELLLLDDNLADNLPPDAVSKDGFLNNQETLALSPLLLESYYDIAEKALDRCIVDPKSKPTIQNFRLDFGTGINPSPIRDNLILGADSVLLNSADFLVRELTPEKSFAYLPFSMRTKYRFIEGYQGNDTVRGWRDYESIYHSVFACMRGTQGYPKGKAFSTVPDGLLLRPAIPSTEIFGVESTYGPRANFKIALRELPDHGRFRVTVTAARYEDGLLLENGPDPIQDLSQGSRQVVCANPGPGQIVEIPAEGIYQVDLLSQRDGKRPAPDASRLDQGLIGNWPLNGVTTAAASAPLAPGQSGPDLKHLAGSLKADAKFVDSPFGKALSLDGYDDAVVVPRRDSMAVGEGDFSVSAWIHPRELRQAGIVCLGKYNWTHGWYFDMPGGNGVLRLETAGPDNKSNGTVASAPGAIQVNQWQHVAAVVNRSGQTRLFVNGFQVAQGKIGGANLDNPKVDLQIGRIQEAHQFLGEISQVRVYRRALKESEIQALIEPGRRFASPPRDKGSEVELALGKRRFGGTMTQPAFLVVRLPAGPLPVSLAKQGGQKIEEIRFSALPENSETAVKFLAFEKRDPHIGVHLGLRRDCGSTLSPVGDPQVVRGTALKKYTFEGAIRNHPSPDVEKDNVNYLAGVREIGVRSEYTDGRDTARLLVHSVEFEGPYFETWPPKPHENLFHENEGEPSDQKAKSLIQRFATKAFRRPISAGEGAGLLAIYSKSRKAGAGFHAALRDVFQVVLTSPQFLFLVEKSASPKGEPLDSHELASKLSYFLWNGPPDAKLLEDADSGEPLQKKMDKIVDRMIDNPLFERFVGEFTSQWLALDKFAVLEADRQRYPRLTPHVRGHLSRESAAFLSHLARQNLPARNLIESDFILANEVVGDYYGLGDRVDSGFRFVPVVHGKEKLGGLLSQPAILAGLSDGRESNPVKRGAWMARKIVAEPPDDPPPNVPTLKEDTKNLSLRERLEKHRNQPGCASCHSRVDPWGIPLEEFDAGGLAKAIKVDSRSTLPDGKEVSGFQELRKHLAQERIDQVAFGLARHLAIYANGRNLSFNELESLKKECLTLKPSGYKVRDLIHLVVKSPLFLEK